MNNILVFGTGNTAKRLVKNLDKSKNRIICYADNDSNKHGTVMLGKRVVSPNDISRLKYDYVLVASVYWKEIKKQLITLGVNKKAILCPLASMKMEKFKKEYKQIYNIRGKLNFICNKWYKREQFYPDLVGIFVNPYYFSRRKLYEDILNYSHYMSGKCMDFGCGTQPYKKLLSVDQYVGVEIDADNKRKGITYYDGHKLPFPDKEFDSIITSEVFEHVINIEEILLELHRVLKDDGVMLLTLPFVYPKHCWPFDYKRYTTEGVKSLVGKAGFECIESSISSGYWECLAQLKNVYWEEEMMTKTKMGAMIKKIIIVFNNIFGILANRILPYSDKIYLDNVFVIKKR